MRVSCPPHRFACHYGIDFPDPEKLIANQMTMDEIREYLGVDSLGYLDVEGMVRATGRNGERVLPGLFHRRLSAAGRSEARQIHHGKARAPRQRSPSEDAADPLRRAEVESSSYASDSSADLSARLEIAQRFVPPDTSAAKSVDNPRQDVNEEKPTPAPAWMWISATA